MNKPFALVVGARTGSLGLSCAEALIRRGYTRIILISPNESSLVESAAYLRQKYVKTDGLDIRYFPQDLAKDDAPKNIFQQVTETTHFNTTVNVLINAAGYMREAPLLECTLDNIEHMNRVMVIAPEQLCLLFAEHMKKHGGGHILNVSSVAGFAGVQDHAVYSGTRGAITNFTLAIRKELKPYNIHCSVVAPGAMKTNTMTPARVYTTYAWLLLMIPEAVARAAIRGLFNDRAIIIPGIQNRLLECITRTCPRRMSAWLGRYALGRRSLKRKN